MQIRKCNEHQETEETAADIVLEAIGAGVLLIILLLFVCLYRLGDFNGYGIPTPNTFDHAVPSCIEDQTPTRTSPTIDVRAESRLV